MASPSAPTDAAKEREAMLDHMLTRLALTDDSKLETVLSKLLPYCISSLSLPLPSIRQKVMEILTHINKRVKHQPSIRLPLFDLWKLCVGVDTGPFVRNFCIVYIEMGFDRLTTEEKANIVPEFIAKLSILSPQHQDILLRVIAKGIGECHSSQIDEGIASKYKAINMAVEGQLFIEFCLHTILYLPVSSSREGPGSPAGLSIAQFNRVSGKDPLKVHQLLQRKMGILNVIEVIELPLELAYPLYLAASGDSQDLVIRRGEELLRRKAVGVNLEDPKLIQKLFLLFNGTVGVEDTAIESRINPGCISLRARLMSVFSRSITAANSFPSTLQCVFGCLYGSGTTSRLKQLGMEFTVWVFKHATMDQLKFMGPVILSGLLKSLDGSSLIESDSSAREMKAFAFQAIGLLTQRLPQLFRDKTEMAVRLFHALKVEDQSLRSTIQETTNCVALAYKDAPQPVLKDLEALLLENSQAVQSEARFCAVRWATSLFNLRHFPSRFICMIGAADNRMDIREMALEGLFLMKAPSQTLGQGDDPKYPQFSSMLDYICQQQPKLLDTSEAQDRELLFPSAMYTAMIRFLLKCYKANFDTADLTREAAAYSSSMLSLCLILEHAMAYDGSIDLHSTASKGLVFVGSEMPEMIASRYAGRISWLKKFLSHVDIDTRESTSRLLGIACSALTASAASELISELCSLFNRNNKIRFESHHGAICAVGYVLAQCMTGTPHVPDGLVHSSISSLVDVVKSEGSALAATAMEALGHIGLRCTLPALDHGPTSAGVLTTLHERLIKLLNSDDIKSIQKIVISLGHVSMKETSSAVLNEALDLIFSLCRSKVEDVLFAVGEALSFIWGAVPVTADVILKTDYTSLSQSSNYLSGEVSIYVSRNGSTKETEANEDVRSLARDVITKKLFDGLLYSSRKEERCAGTVWLLSLTMYCGRHYKIQQLLPEIQEAFSHLLGEQNELTQELASQGMSIVYELGDPSMKEDLVKALVTTLTGSAKRKRAVKLMEDSEVFQEGAIGESLGGGKLSTYKELCNLANEMGQPDLIYKFMDLANYQASLNSKRGAAFGFSKIAKLAGDALKPHLALLVPRLVRYQFDPDKNVQDAMGHIWKSLVADPKKTVDEYFDNILEDLLSQCGSRLWRSREASCLALADIIHGRKFSQVSKHLKRIWIAAFRAMDDIKETVRNAGDSLCRAVTSLTIRLCDVSLTAASDASQTLDIVLPFLLVEGIVSKVATVQKSSIQLVMKLSKGAGSAIRPHLPNLVYCMLESLSSLEDQSFNYVELHVERVGIHAEKLDNLRISVAKDSAMWDTLDLCLKVVDVPTLDELIPRLVQLVRSGVGLNTRVGVASFISLLVQKVDRDIKPFTGTLLRVMFPAVQEEKSSIGKRAFAAACANLLKYSGSSQTQKLIEDAVALHNKDRNALVSCVLLLKNFSHIAADVVSGYHATILPVVFVERFGDEKDVSSQFEELWEEIASSERITLELYLSEIVLLICNCLTSSSWPNKRKSAKAITRLAEVLVETLSLFHKDLLNNLLKELPGRLWEGKEEILHAIAALCTACHRSISMDEPATPNLVLGTISSVCKKKIRPAYREAAFSCLQQVIKAFNKSEFFDMVLPMLFEVCTQTSSLMPNPALFADAAKAEDRSEEDTSVPTEKVFDCITSSISVAQLPDIVRQGKDLIHVFFSAFSPTFSWIVKMSVFSSIKEFFSKFHHDALKTSDDSSLLLDITALVHEALHSLAPKVVECISIIKIAQVHASASECLLEMIEVHRTLVPKKIEVGFRDELVHLIEIERNEYAKSLLKKVSRHTGRCFNHGHLDEFTAAAEPRNLASH
ncbi:proteasome-associated protein ECM29 homolog isoform X2 [Amborella trichopoda]|uniref:Proteasome-associated protein ECM29 homolog n=1 Tax=Amborella trichopoda TaxID=13333 RepID=W1NQC6_AMBTC|nr:proteasome-associated protein ECM29 homolog isoform X2 [Amborella trichopoda]ERM99116.1 hypothetical protein AMTR_s00101p00142180 [Amborella trichopoda]|eukprot:XP_006836263.1 proteasome-associated protein ECM29 homolog isoform X2 [Amborella trichopoda]